MTSITKIIQFIIQVLAHVLKVTGKPIQLILYAFNTFSSLKCQIVNA